MTEKPFKTVIEPFRIKSVEPLRRLSQSQRAQVLREAHYNLFNIRAENILIDLLTDSGTSAMSAAQWAKIMEGDESYAGCKSFYEFEEVVKELTGHKFIFPTHQGRAAERILFSIVGGEGKIFPNNTHFDTTRASIEYTKSLAVDLSTPESRDTQSNYPFKGNMDTKALEELLIKVGSHNIPLVMMTITNNSAGGQPVSLANIKQVSAICKKYGIKFFIDACRFAENSYFIKMKEEGQGNRSVQSIAKEIFSLADGCTMSAKKDGLVNIGGFLTVNDEELANSIRNLEILTEGFPTYGGLAGRDLAAIAQGLREVIDEEYLEYRIASLAYFGNKLEKAGLPIIKPIGGHAVFIDAKKLLPQLPAEKLPGQVVACEFYRLGGVRGVEIGSFMFGKYSEKKFIPCAMEYVRLAFPRRVYTQAHIDYVAEVAERVAENANKHPGFDVVSEPPFLRHFTAKLALSTK